MQGRPQHCVTSVSHRCGSWINQSGSGHRCSPKPHLCSTGWNRRVLHGALASLEAPALRAGCGFLMGCDQEGWSCALLVLTLGVPVPLRSGTPSIKQRLIFSCISFLVTKPHKTMHRIAQILPGKKHSRTVHFQCKLQLLP